MWAGPDSAQQSSLLLLVWVGPGPDIRAGPEPAWPRKEKQGGLFFPSHPPACRTIFVLHAGGA